MQTVDGLDGLEKLFVGIQLAYDENVRPKVEELLESQMDELEKDHKRYFDKSESSAGNKWAKLAPATIARKGHDTILIDTGQLVRSLTQRGSNYSIREFFRGAEGTGLLFGTGVPYATFHMTGTSRMPARPEVGLTPDRIEDFETKLGDIVVEQILTG